MAGFEAIQAAVMAGVDRTFAERLGLYFLAAGKADAQRRNVTVRAVLRVGTGEQQVTADRAAGIRARIAAGHAEAYIMRPTYRGPMPRKGDRLRALERDGQPFWEITTVDDRSDGRLVLKLVEA